MELKQLQSFCAVVQYSSYTRAAEKLYLSQPTVSTHIRQLEEESGHPAAAPAPREDQVSFAAVAEGEVIDRLRRAQVDSLTPLEALQLLYELKKKLT